MISASQVAPVLLKTEMALQPVFYQAANASNHELAVYLVPGFLAVIALRKIRNLLFNRRNSNDYILNRSSSKFAELAYLGRSILEKVYAKAFWRLIK